MRLQMRRKCQVMFQSRPPSHPPSVVMALAHWNICCLLHTHHLFTSTDEVILLPRRSAHSGNGSWKEFPFPSSCVCRGTRLTTGSRNGLLLLTCVCCAKPTDPFWDNHKQNKQHQTFRFCNSLFKTITFLHNFVPWEVHVLNWSWLFQLLNSWHKMLFIYLCFFGEGE